MITARDAFESLNQHAGVSGTCRPDLFLSRLRAATDLVWSRGDWRDTRGYGKLKLDCRGYFRLPWRWEHIRQAWLCPNHSPGSQFSTADCWFQELSGEGVAPDVSGPIRGLNETGVRPCTAFAPPEGPFRIRQRFELSSDETLIYRGTDRYGSDVSESLTGDCLGEVEFWGIEGIRKAQGSSNVVVHAVKGSGSSQEVFFLSLFDARQENPQFTEFFFSGHKPPHGWIGVRYRKRLVQAAEMDDPLPIQNINALAFALEAINYRGKDNDLFRQNLALAEEQLEEELWKETGDRGQTIKIEAPLNGSFYPRGSMSRLPYDRRRIPGPHNI